MGHFFYSFVMNSLKKNLIKGMVLKGDEYLAG